MSAVPEPSLSKPDDTRIRKEIERLSQEQNKALEIAICMATTPEQQKEYDERHKQIVSLLTQLTILEAGNFSKLSAKMVELSLQEPQPDLIQPDAITTNRGVVSSPLPWVSRDVQRIAPQPELLVRKGVDAVTHPNDHQQPDGRSSFRINQRFFKFGRRILGLLELATERSVIGQRTGSLIGQLSRRTARPAQFAANRISAIKVYRCRDCGREVAFRSRPRTFTECYILPLLLIQPVRCAACFRRDYWPIITRVRERSHVAHETVDRIPRQAA